MYLSSFTGNSAIKESLLGALASGRLSHGLLICGEKGMGINHFARLLAADIVGSKNLQAIEDGSDPCVQTVRGEGARGIIKVERIRLINDNVNYSSLSGEKRAVIIENCENFNQSSANALLKNLEEPKDDITYILTSANPRAIPATIRSRCGVYTLAFPSKEETAEYFRTVGASESTVRALREVYGENIGKIKAALEDGARYEILQKAINAYGFAQKKETYSLASVCYNFVKDKKGFECLLEDLQRLCHKNLNRDNVKKLGVLQKYSEILKTNAGLNLVIENFATEFAK